MHDKPPSKLKVSYLHVISFESIKLFERFSRSKKYHILQLEKVKKKYEM